MKQKDLINSDRTLKQLVLNANLWKGVLRGMLISIGSAVVIGISIGIWTIVVAVKYNLPNKITSLERGFLIIQQQRTEDNKENKYQHLMLNARDDKAVERFNKLILNLIDIKIMLKMAITTNDLGMKKDSLSIPVLIVKRETN